MRDNYEQLKVCDTCDESKTRRSFRWDADAMCHASTCRVCEKDAREGSKVCDTCGKMRTLRFYTRKGEGTTCRICRADNASTPYASGAPSLATLRKQEAQDLRATELAFAALRQHREEVLNQ